MTKYDLYKPFRNFMRQFPLEESLVIVWHYVQHVMNDHDLPDILVPAGFNGVRLDLDRLILPWELEILTRELILNAPAVGQKSFQNWNNLADAINWIKRLSDQMDSVESDGYDVMREIHRIAHRQFPWQVPHSSTDLIRYYKIYGGTEMTPLIEREFGMSPEQLMQVAFGISSRFLSHQGLRRTQSYESIGISDEVRDAFLGRVVTSLTDLKDATEQSQDYGRNWAYAYNPLKARPLIAFDPKHPDRLLCPLPKWLHDRFTEGLFYDLANQDGIENAYGMAYQRYVGEVLAAACSTSPFVITAEATYYVGKNLNHGVDWILEDGTGTVFVECKTKRLTHDAKFDAGVDGLTRDLDIMAVYISKHYRNILDALGGKTPWRPKGRPSFALICTLESWWIFSSTVVNMLDAAVRKEMTKRKLDLTLLDSMPYVLASVAEMEKGFQVIRQTSIEPFFSLKITDAHRRSAMGPFLNTNFLREKRTVLGDLFPEDFEALMRGLLEA